MGLRWDAETTDMSDYAIGPWGSTPAPQPWGRPRAVEQARWSPRTTILFIIGANLLGWTAIAIPAAMLLG
jgi:hypothetical protein